MSRLRSTLCLLIAASPLACAESARVEARYAPEFTPGRATVAVLGAFHGGRLGAERWYPIAPRVSSALGKASCAVGVGDDLKRLDPDLLAKIDESVAENGITDELLAELAPKTDAELIMTISVHGRVERSEAPAAGGGPTMAGARPGAMGGMRPRGRQRGTVIEWRGIELAASLFSVKEKRGVGRIMLRHPGTNLDEAARVFAEKIGKDLAGSTCVGWSWAKKAP